jgi:hypothetical protein
LGAVNCLQPHLGQISARKSINAPQSPQYFACMPFLFTGLLDIAYEFLPLINLLIASRKASHTIITEVIGGLPEATQTRYFAVLLNVSANATFTALRLLHQLGGLQLGLERTLVSEASAVCFFETEGVV